jgi:tetratricopeptide (TPR) repeat protein
MIYLFFAGRSLCKFVSGDFAEAIASAEKGININPNSPDNYLYMAAALAELGQVERAKEQIRRGLRFVPKVNLLVISRAIESGNFGWARYHDALRKAGLPE